MEEYINMDLKKIIKNKRNIIIILVITFCLVAVFILILPINKLKAKERQLGINNENTKKPLNKQEPVVEDKKIVGPISGSSDIDNSKDKNKDIDKNYNTDDSKIPHGKKEIEFEIKNPNLRKLNDKEITQDTAIGRMRKFVIPEITKNTGITSIQIKINKIEKVYNHECYIIELNSVRNDNVSFIGRYALSMNGKFMYRQDLKTNEYSKYIPEK